MASPRIRVAVVLFLASPIWFVNGRRLSANPWMLPPRASIHQTSRISSAKLGRSLLSRGGGGYNEDWYERATASQRSGASAESSDDDDGGYYQDDRYGDSRAPKRRNQKSNTDGLATLLHKLQHGDRQIGILLLGSGAGITMLGISLFFNKTLLRLGNLLFIGGVPVSMGPSRTMGYFVKPEKLRATACLAFGIFLVFVGSPMFGIMFELFGLLNLFGNMFPFVWAIAKNLPVVGPLLKSFSGEGGNASHRRRQTKQHDEGHYDDDYGRDDYHYPDSYGNDNNSWGNRQQGDSSGGYY